MRAPAAKEGELVSSAYDTSPGDLLLIASSGLEAARQGPSGAQPGSAARDFARAARGRPLAAALEELLAPWKAPGASSAPGDLLLLAARRA